jgi:hypothetical protein
MIAATSTDRQARMQGRQNTGWWWLPCLAGFMAISASAVAKNTAKLNSWIPVGDWSVPSLPTDIADESAGCAVVGFHVNAEGSTARPRVMQGAYTANIERSQRLAFEQALLSRVAQWRFKPENRRKKSWPSFEMQTVGFQPRSTAGDMRLVVGAKSQFASLQGLCEITDLATWGTKNAIGVDEAKSRNLGKVVVPEQAGDMDYWTPTVPLSPPHYPPLGYLAGVSGCLVAGYVVREDGVPDSLKILSLDFGNPGKDIETAFAQAAVKAVSEWRYSPGPDNPGRIAALIQTPMSFRLDGSGGRDCKTLGAEAIMAGQSSD